MTRFRRYSRAPLLALGVWSLIATAQIPAKKSGFFDTTTGPINTTQDPTGGITPSEEAQLSAEEYKILQRFQAGRASSAVNSQSRFSGILEMHNEQFDSLTSHDHPSNALEGGVEKAVTGKSGSAAAGNQRVVDLQNAKDNDSEGRCKNGMSTSIKYPNGSPAPCQNISGALVDYGAAHGDGGKDPDFTEKHRSLDVTKAVYDASIQAGGKYAAAAIHSASDYAKEVAAPPNATRITSADGLTTSFNVTSNGQTNVVNVAANPALLGSEASFLEELKQHTTDLEWESLRCARLAGFESIKPVLNSCSDLIGDNTLPAAAKTQAEAKLIVTYYLASDYSVCIQGSTITKGVKSKTGNPTLYTLYPPMPNLLVKPEDEKKCNDVNQNNVDYISLREYVTNNSAPVDPNVLNSLLAQAYQAYNQGIKNAKQSQKNEATLTSQVLSCLPQNIWCYDPIHANIQVDAVTAKNPNADPVKLMAQFLYKPVQGDIGNAYDDDREAIFNKLSLANQGSLDNFEQTMKTVDFSASTDAKTPNKPYQKMMDQLRANQQAARIIRTGQGDSYAVDENGNPVLDSNGNPILARQAALADPNNNTKSVYQNTQNFDTRTMNTRQLFGRNPARDGSTFDLGGMTTSSNGASSSSSAASAPPAQAPAQSNTNNNFSLDSKYTTPGMY